jgi:hypothetical protein
LSGKKQYSSLMLMEDWQFQHITARRLQDWIKCTCLTKLWCLYTVRDYFRRNQNPEFFWGSALVFVHQQWDMRRIWTFLRKFLWTGFRIMVHPTEFSQKRLNSVSIPIKRISFDPLQPGKCVYVNKYRRILVELRISRCAILDRSCRDSILWSYARVRNFTSLEIKFVEK